MQQSILIALLAACGHSWASLEGPCDPYGLDQVVGCSPKEQTTLYSDQSTESSETRTCEAESTTITTTVTTTVPVISQLESLRRPESSNLSISTALSSHAASSIPRLKYTTVMTVYETTTECPEEQVSTSI